MRGILSAARARAALAALPALALVAWTIAPLATGVRTFVLRDVVNTHLALRAGPAAALAAGELPLVDPRRGGGQPALGNANAVLWYPTNALLAVASPLWQLNAHLWIHWLAAFAAAYWLARRWGGSELAAAAAASTYALSGWFLSQLNLYNAVAAAALAPALAAALLAAGERAGRRRAAALAGLVWALLLAGGDPLLAALGLGFALAVALARHGRRLLGWHLVAGLVAGTLAAAPQWVETARIWSQSYRGFLGGAPGGGARGPAALVDLVVPLFFGSPAAGELWSQPLFGGFPPLYFSLAPGFVALALALAAGSPKRREARVALALAVAGTGLVFAGTTGLGATLARATGGLFRYPDKLVLWPMLALVPAVGVGVDRLLRGAPARRGLALVALAGGVTAAAGLAWALELEVGRRLARLLLGDELAAAVALRESGRWELAALGGAATLLAALLVARRLRARQGATTALVVGLHAASQLALLAPLVLTDRAAIYRAPPTLAAHLPPGTVVVHGGYDRLFGVAGPGAPPAAGDLPGYLALQRRAHAELYGASGRLHGLRGELDPSPEGLSHFTLHAAAEWMRRAGDRERVALLAATGVERLVLPRELAGDARDGVRLLRDLPADGAARALWIYVVEPTLPPALVAGRTLPAPHVGAALEAIAAPGFDPRSTAVVAGTAPSRDGPPGTTEIVREGREHVELVVESSAGGVLVLRRAFLPIWRAAIDGRPARPTIANVTRLALELPPGRHEVRLWISRRPLAAALLASAAGALGLLALAGGRRAEPRGA